MPIVLGGGLGQIGASLILMNIALPFLPAGRTALLAYTTPIWVAGLQAVVFRARPSKREAIALVLGLGGIGLLINPASIDWGAPGVLVGSCIMLMSAALMGGTILLLRHHRWEGPTLDLIFWETLVALVPLGLLAVAFDAGKPVNWGVQALFCVLYSGALESAFGYWASQTIQRALPPMATSVILLAVPVVGIFTGAVVLGETITLGDLVGFAVTLTGIVTLSLFGKQRAGETSNTQDGG
jgi:drug/metabolite transporter (DMT)-like permease